VASPPPCARHAPDTTPILCVSQPYGDTHTVFILHGTGYMPSVAVTVRLVGVGVSADHPVTDTRGSFAYAVDQGHRYFSGPMPPGTYHVVVTAVDEPSASASFRVDPVPEGGPPGPPGP
jgi:hypothetical protein